MGDKGEESMGDKKEQTHEERIRMKQFAAMLLAYGYALLAGAVWDPFTKHQLFGLRNLAIGVFAVALHGLSLYIAPKGEAE